MSFSERVKEVRGDLTQKIFAEKIGVHVNTVSRWERGEQTPDQKDLCTILSLFSDISPEWLLTGEGDRKRRGQSQRGMSKNDNDATFRHSRSVEFEQVPFDSLGMVEGMGLLTKIYSAADPVYIRAINANLMAFSDAVESKALAKDMENRLQELESKLAEMDELKVYVLDLKRQEEAREKARLEEQSSKRKVA